MFVAHLTRSFQPVPIHITGLALKEGWSHRAQINSKGIEAMRFMQKCLKPRLKNAACYQAEC